jgi:hypothetical protein
MPFTVSTFQFQLIAGLVPAILKSKKIHKIIWLYLNIKIESVVAGQKI